MHQLAEHYDDSYSCIVSTNSYILDDNIGNYFKEFDDPVAKSKLTEEVTITLNAIKEALLDKSYMTKGIKEKLKGR